MAMKDAIMNFELRSLDLDGAASHKADALVVLVTQSHKSGKGVLPELVAAAVKAGDLESKCGKMLALYKVPGVMCSRAVLVACETGTPKQVRQAIVAAVGALKSASLKLSLIHISEPTRPY